jgi:tetratricopeptide (TPR) repeat protein/opacity protein-like surface antigen
MIVTRLVRIIVNGVLFSMMLAGAAAAEPCETVVGRLATVEGQVEVQRTGSPNWQAGVLGGDLCQGDTVRAGARSRATISLINQAVLRVDQNTAMRLDNITGVTEERSVLSLLKGAFQSFSRKPRGFEVNTPYLNGSIEGTEFVFRVTDKQSELTVLEGLVVASNSQGNVTVSGGESAIGEQGKAPYMRTVVSPIDAVQWSLYYPPVMTAHGVSPDAQAPLQNAASLLSVGRVDEARASIDKALEQDPNAGLAYALRAVINVVQNNNDQALADGKQAVAMNPDSPAAMIALSYAQQASYQIPAARDTLLQAVDEQPGAPLAWARLSELQLMLGDRKQSRIAASRALAIDPNLERAHITRGFAALAEFKNAVAMAAFKRAITLSSSDPMAHLGLGLARISDGNLAEGGRDIEVAVALDSNNALLRAYLGKTYFEEKRTPLDTEQFAIAKQLDPNDPTAWLYDGIAKQTENRPVEAVQDLERSIELNDNRAVYRSRLLLDKDRAARGTSLARAYKDLGFTQLGVNESTESLAVDPSNAAAHRFLSDSYQGVRRHEISRVSELLQAQLMQDVNINPVQPSLSETNLNIVTLGGPAAAGFNEFTPLFERNKTQFNVTGFGGNNDTYGGEAVVSGLYGPASFSIGAFSYDTDGWRTNNDQDRNIYNLFGQVALTPQLNIQAEFRHSESWSGDLAFNFDPDDFFRDLSDDRDQDTYRLGMRYTPSSDGRHNFLLSYIHNELDQSLSQSELLDPFDPNDPFEPATTLSFDSDVRDNGDQVEAQHIYQNVRVNVVSGAAYSDSDRKIKDRFVISLEDIGPVDSFGGDLDQTVEHYRGYSYAVGNIPLGEGVVDLTIGASYDDYKEGILDETNFNPKFGALWQVNNNLRLRAAAFKVVKPLLVNNRTLEPTQVAGFNQFFDDINGTEAWRYGAGVDWNISRNLAVGAEATWRDLDEPVFLLFQEPPDTDFEDRDEQLHKLYAYWTPTERIGVTSELVYDLFKSETGEATEFGNLPKKVETFRIPVGINYFHPSGFFAGAVGSYVDQDVDRSASSTQAEGWDNFFLVDVAAGYRFPKRRGIASIAVTNLFDKEFDYQDDSYREFRGESSTGPYFPDRIIRASVTVNF